MKVTKDEWYEGKINEHSLDRFLDLEPYLDWSHESLIRLRWWYKNQFTKIPQGDKRYDKLLDEIKDEILLMEASDAYQIVYVTKADAARSSIEKDMYQHLEEQVNLYVRYGYRPIGSPYQQFIEKTEGMCWAQAMFNEEKIYRNSDPFIISE